ncbi:hypothetical protein A1Q2_05921 [Trichosporon asahii var. asahii CBS 8904]|uniref:Uncharacterized protein n=1 Tax=Trichosporon asahii var. asahii (strain CBS 8904) TaxID=1220162 RepID=K1VG49_TRIAC|nr:hypothetical protein A1Q2_05921 [Trichosporon asahii var. asahii CBS 8904]
MQEAAAEKARKKAEEKAETEHDKMIATIIIGTLCGVAFTAICLLCVCLNWSNWWDHIQRFFAGLACGCRRRRARTDCEQGPDATPAIDKEGTAPHFVARACGQNELALDHPSRASIAPSHDSDATAVADAQASAHVAAQPTVAQDHHASDYDEKNTRPEQDAKKAKDESTHATVDSYPY